jgi:hypothetical protein
MVMVLSEFLTLARIEPFYSWNTPICWTGFIVFADSLVYRARGRSRIRSNPSEFAWLTLLSIPLWLVFEGYNQIIRNWYYTGLPENWSLRMFGYAWSFATIWPAIFEGADLIGVVRAGRAGKADEAGRSSASTAATPPARPAPPVLPAPPARHAPPALSLAVGTLMLVLPFVVPPMVARYLAAPVFLGFIFLLDPLNKAMGGPSLTDDTDWTIDLSLSGLLCGGLWEFWNYWSGAKWHYTVPIMEHVKIFEMPLPGYLGFPPFALECFTMLTFVQLMFRRVAS